MRKSVLKRVLSVVLACVIMMSIFASIPMQAGAASKKSIKDATVIPCPVRYTGYIGGVNFNIYYKGTKLEEGTDYKVEYPYDYRKPGKYEVTIKGINNYKDSKKASFTIYVPVPTVKTPKRDCNPLVKVSWSEVYGKYIMFEVQRKAGSNGTWKTVGTTSDYSLVDTNAPKKTNTKYYYRVRAYVYGHDFNYIKYYSNWSTASKGVS